MIGRVLELRHTFGKFAFLSLPLRPSTIHDFHLCMPIHTKQPEGVAGVPVILVAVEHNSRIRSNTPATHQALKLVLVDKVATEPILYIHMPVELHRTKNMANF